MIETTSKQTRPTQQQLKEREAGLRAQVARLEAQGFETRADLDRMLTEQSEMFIQVRLVVGIGMAWFRRMEWLVVRSDSQAHPSNVW